MEDALSTKAKASASEGNFNTLIMLRVKNRDTATLLVDSLPMVNIIEDVPATSVNDAGILNKYSTFSSSNEDRLQVRQVPMIGVDDVMVLPKGQAFVLVNGGELYKIRLPLPI